MLGQITRRLGIIPLKLVIGAIWSLQAVYAVTVIATYIFATHTLAPPKQRTLCLMGQALDKTLFAAKALLYCKSMLNGIISNPL
jgi:hypothetical protein